jgi:hypothetical protein
MFRNWIAKLLTILLTLSVPLPLGARHATQEKAPTIQEQIVQMPAGSVVEVKTQAKQKLRGRLGAITADSFELQTATGGTIQTQSLRFDQVKSVKPIQSEKGMSTAAKIGIGVLAVFGAMALIGGIACASGGCSY